MPALQTSLSPTPEQIAQFQTQGYVILPDLLTPDQIDQIVDRFEPLFATQFETGIYPDEWYGRPGLSQPNATQQMTGMWRCDRAIARFTLAQKFARTNAALMGWNAARYAFDACWIKPPNAPPVSFHRNNTLAASLRPPSLVTCWIALSHATAETGTLQIVPGSHRWHGTDTLRFLHAPREDYRAPLWRAAQTAGITDPEIISIELPPGSAVCFHGDLWHGSDRNRSSDKIRRGLAISTLPAEVEFQPNTDQGYIFNRYRRVGDTRVDESFFPILWSQDGYRTPFLSDYCDNTPV